MSIFSIENPMPPDWLMYPEIPIGSIGWRMGYGEYYGAEQFDWFSSLSKEDQERYNELFPMPKMWYYDNYKRAAIMFWTPNGRPIYGLSEHLKEYQHEKQFDYQFFWGHQPSVEGSLTSSCFSQWWKSDFRFGIEQYCCVEQYLMAKKAQLFEDNQAYNAIMDNDDPKVIKALGRKVKKFNEMVWSEYKYQIALNGNYAKFMQNQKLKEFLLATGDKIIVEASPYDAIWGIKMSQTNKGIQNPNNWKGENLLGFALMEVRSEIKRVCKNEERINWKQLHVKFSESRVNRER